MREAAAAQASHVVHSNALKYNEKKPKSPYGLRKAGMALTNLKMVLWPREQAGTPVRGWSVTATPGPNALFDLVG